MANPISNKMKTGAIGELLVQIRLLQYGIQTTRPSIDSGNDLIGTFDGTVKFIQIKTTSRDIFPMFPAVNRKYDLLFIVQLRGCDNELSLDQSNLYVLPHVDVRIAQRSWSYISKYSFSDKQTGFNK